MRTSFASTLIVSLFTTFPILADWTASETLSGRKGVFRLLSADVNETSDYHFRTSIEYFQQKGLLEDVRNSKIHRTKATIGIGYAVTENIHLSLSGGFNMASSTPQTATGSSTTGSQSIDLIKTAFAATGSYDVGQKFLGLGSKRFMSAFSLWIDFSKPSRFIKGINIIPTLALTSDWSDLAPVPVRVHANTGFRFKNSGRYYNSSDTIQDFDRFVTETINSYAITGALGVELPFEYITPSVEFHIEKLGSLGFAQTPKWVTPGVKTKPLPQKNIEIFAAVDVGLSNFTPTTSTAVKPEAGPVPLWNAVVGFGISQFGRREGEIGVDRSEFENLQKTLRERETTLASHNETFTALRRDLEYNTVEGRVLDAQTKQPIPDVIISFPENPEFRPSKTNKEGKFVRYFRSMPGARMLFSIDGFESSSKFLALKPGERVNTDVELRRDTGLAVADFIALLSDENGQAIEGSVTLTPTAGGEAISATSDATGQVNLKVTQGTYDVTISSKGSQSVKDQVTFERGKTVLRSYSLNRSGAGSNAEPTAPKGGPTPTPAPKTETMPSAPQEPAPTGSQLKEPAKMP